MAKPQLEHVLAHWATLIEGFQTSSLEFYASVEAGLKRREVPDIRFSRIDYRESGVLSAKREYLRVARHRLRFDICAAPFGTGFFFSWWQVVPPLRFGIFFGALLLGLQILVARATYGFLAQHELLRYVLPFWYKVGLALFAAFLVFLLLCILARVGLAFLDDFLLPIPVAGAFYRRFFRPLTYYELDTMSMYRTAVHAAVTEVIDGLTNVHGLRALSAEGRRPVMREFFQR